MVQNQLFCFFFLVRFPMITMLYVSSTFLLLVNAVTCRRVRNLFNRVAILILLYSGIICYDNLNIISLDTGIDIYGGLFHSSQHIILPYFLLYNSSYSVNYCILPQTFKKINGSNGKENVFFLFNPLYNHKTLNRYINVLKIYLLIRYIFNVFTRYLLIRFISLNIAILQLFFLNCSIVGSVVIFGIILLLGSWISSWILFYLHR